MNQDYSSVINPGSNIFKTELQQSLFPKKGPSNSKHKKFSFFYRLYYYLFPTIQKIETKVFFSGLSEPPNYFCNEVRNQKYNIISFVPCVLFNQFKFFFNMFYLLLAISQFFPPLKVGMLFTYIAPLGFVLFLTMLKEAYDDIKRMLKDREINNTNYKKLTKDGLVYKKSSNIRVGDIIEINANQRIPADSLLLYTTDPSGNIFIRTDQLDGETDWKLRKPISYTQKYLSSNNPISLLEMPGYIKINPPNPNIYKFEGIFSTLLDSSTKIKEPLNLDNTLWTNTVLASGKILAMVIYVGPESRMALNTEQPRTKIGKLDMELNWLSKLLFIFMLIISIFLVIFGTKTLNFSSNFIRFFRYLILLSSIIPISMRVNLDFAKIVYCYKINKDKEIPNTIARNSVIPEELGRIEFLLTDKTGTLTQNDMVFKRLSLENKNYTQDNVNFINQSIQKSYKSFFKNSKPLAINESDHSSTSFSSDSLNVTQEIIKKPTKKRPLFQIVRALALCHNVTPIYENENQDEIELKTSPHEIQINILEQPLLLPYQSNKKRSYQASSPDEIALVRTADSMGIELIDRTQNQIKIGVSSYIETFNILNIFPFSSETKRMGIIVKSNETNQIIFYLKGADTVMKNVIPEVKRGFLCDECDSLAREGLRTLVFAKKDLSQNDYDAWKVRYEQAQTSMTEREEKTKKTIESLEKNMEFLGITGVEDKLQENVCLTLENLRGAGIHIWMLTGDKLETAQCIAISAGIKANNQKFFSIREEEDPDKLKKLLNEFKESNELDNKNIVLIIDGTSLKTALDSDPKFFFEITSNAPSVVCCRCSPTQKSVITEGIKIFSKKRTAAIGDGGNDVGMIQKADVGIGIVGKEGMQAALASDFSIEKFQYLNRLLLWHGRLSYKRSANLSQFVIHRGLIISIIQTVFMTMFYFVPILVINGNLQLGYSTAFTILPVFSLIFDEDVDVKSALRYPPLYNKLQKGRELNLKTFLIWVWASIYQGVLIMVLCITVFNHAFLDIVTITFTTLILTEFMNIYSSIHRLHIVMIISQILSVILYFVTIITMKSVFMVSTFSWDFLLKIFLVTLLTWFPLHLVKVIKRYMDPNDYQKIMMNTLKEKDVLTNII